MSKLLISRIRVIEMKLDKNTGKKTFPKREIIDRENISIESDNTLSEFKDKTKAEFQALGFENIEIDLGFKDFSSNKKS